MKSGRPAIGRYSWLRSGSLRRSSSAWRKLLALNYCLVEACLPPSSRTNGAPLSFRTDAPPLAAFCFHIFHLVYCKVLFPLRPPSPHDLHLIAHRLACLTTGKTHGLALLSLYAPMPRSTLFGSVSLRYAAINPKSGSSGARGTTSCEKAEATPFEPMVVSCAWSCSSRCWGVEAIADDIAETPICGVL